MGRWDRPENVLRDLMDSEGGEPKDSAASRRVWLRAKAALRGGRANRIRAALIDMMWDSGGEPRDDRWSRAVWKRAYAAVGGEQMFRSPEKRRQNPSKRTFRDWNWGIGAKSNEARRVWPDRGMYAVVSPGAAAGTWYWRVYPQIPGHGATRGGACGSSNAAKAEATAAVAQTPRSNPSRAVNLIPSPYYHESKQGKDIVAGYGIWDTVASDWVIADGYPTRDAAADAIHKISARVKGGYGLIETVRAEQARVKRRWRGVPHTNCRVCT